MNSMMTMMNRLPSASILRYKGEFLEIAARLLNCDYDYKSDVIHESAKSSSRVAASSPV